MAVIQNSIRAMKIFIPTNELNEQFIHRGFSLKPLVIEAYQYHLNHSLSENTQNRFSKNVKTGTNITKTGKTIEE